VSAVPLPQPRAAAATPATSSRRSLAAALFLGAAGATVVLLAAGRIWAEGSASVGGGTVSLDVKGSDVTGVPTALAIVGLAALVAVFAVRRAGRLLVAALLALSGAGASTAALLGASDTGALDEKAARTTGDAASTVEALSHTVWPYVTAAGGVLILLAGLLALRYGRAVAVHVRTLRARRQPPCPQGTPGRPRPSRGPLEGPGPGRGPDARRVTPAPRPPRRTGQ
jgi:uncharacterized membrane protein (TIGR02234 family)